MANRITCPSCDASLTYDDEKRGKKVRCRKCEEIFTLPLAGGAKRKRSDDNAIQEGRKIRAKARSRDDDDENDDDDDDGEDRPSRKSKKAKNGAPILLLALGGGGFLVVLAIGFGIGAWLLLKPADRSVAKAGPAPDPVEKAADPVQKPKDGPRLPIAGDPNADKPLPENMDREVVERVKQATLYVRVTTADGQMGSGTGFLAIEKGLVVTNAHVVGMLKPNSRPPRVLDVVMHSGQPNETKMPGKLLGVDRASDLAFIRVNHPKLPPMLALETKRKLFDTQKLYVLGFPFGEGLGKEITVSPSAVASLRSDSKTGEVDKIQVHGGMQPGNSGGPVVNTQGTVIGVSVSIMSGTQINFAIPVHKVQKAMEGRVSETTLGQAVTSNGQIRLPVKVACLDPLQRISKVSVEVWTGPPGAPRPYSVGQPQPMAGDGPRQTHTVTYQNGVGSIELPLSGLNAGQVYWVQPVITNAGGTQWGVGVPAPMELNPIERQPGNLTANFNNVKERTVKLKSSKGLSIFVQNENKNVGANVIEVDLLEIVSPESKDGGYRIRTVFGATKLSSIEVDKSLPRPQALVELFREIPPVYIVDKSNQFLKRADRLLRPSLDKRLKEDTQDAYAQLCNSAEAVMLNVPNRVVEPLYSWPAKLPLMVRGAGRDGGGPTTVPAVIDLALTCTYEGTRKRGQRDEGLITVTGKVQERGSNAQILDGVVNGKLAFDLQGGFFSAGQMKINLQLPISGPNGKELPANAYFDIEMTRTPGNTKNIQVPPESTGPAGGPPPIIAKGKVLVNFNGALQANDPVVQLPKFKEKNARMKVQPLQMQAGKTYVISLDSDAFDSYLLLQDQTGKIVAEDDDSGGGKTGLNARIEFKCMQTGVYRIIATALDGKLGAFQFRVQEAQ